MSKKCSGCNSSQEPASLGKNSKKLNVDLQLVWSHGVLQMTN